MTRVMIDLETLGVDSGCHIMSISSVAFDDDFKEVDRIHMNIERTNGFHASEQTMKWWDKQPVEARQMLSSNQIPAINALSNFTLFLSMFGDDVEIWCNGASFDFPILKHYYNHFGIPVPWKFWNERCLRTMKNIIPHDTPEFTGIPHYGIDDCLHQIKQLKEICKKIN